MDRPDRLAGGRTGRGRVTVVIEERVRRRDGIAFADSVPESPYRARWEQEAADDHVKSAIADGSATKRAEDGLTGKIAPLWSRFPAGVHTPALLDVGAGYGRIDLYLARDRGLTCDTLCAVDISATMLSRLLEYREQYDVFPGADLEAICASADDLPIEDGSIDLAVSSAVFLHMGKGVRGTRSPRDRARPQAGRGIRVRQLFSERAQSVQLAAASQAASTTSPERA